jgi:nitroreductase
VPPSFLTSLARLLRGRPRIPPSLADNEMLLRILKRRSVRSFAAREIPEEVFGAILEAGRLAPSTVNLQSWSFVLFSREQWKQSFDRPIPFHAPRAVIILGDTHRVRQVMEAFPQAPLVEYTIAVLNASLAAMAMNLAAETGRSGLLDPAYLKEKLGLPPSVFPLMTMLFGYPRGSLPPMPPKLPISSIVFQGKYADANPAVLEDWLAQMKAGYKASHPFSSFETQLEVYRSKIGQAERELEEMVFGAEEAGRLQQVGK